MNLFKVAVQISIFPLSGSLVTIGACSYGGRQHFQFQFFSNIIVLLSCRSARYPLPEFQLCKRRNSPFTAVNTPSQSGNMNLLSQECVLHSLDHINRSRNRSWNYNWKIFVRARVAWAHRVCTVRKRLSCRTPLARKNTQKREEHVLRRDKLLYF